MLDLCALCKKRQDRSGQKIDCDTCEDKPPKLDYLSEYLTIFAKRATIARDGTGGLNYGFVIRRAEAESNNTKVQDILIDFINEIELIKAEWRNRK